MKGLNFFFGVVALFASALYLNIGNILNFLMAGIVTLIFFIGEVLEEGEEK